MRESGISIWFFIGISLLGNGALIVAAGIGEWFHPPARPVVLFHLHASLWWGALLLLLGAWYSLRFAPRQPRQRPGGAGTRCTEESLWQSTKK